VFPTFDWRYLVIGLLAAASGLRNATVRRLAVADVTSTSSVVPLLARLVTWT
jgi:hypothetical protein